MCFLASVPSINSSVYCSCLKVLMENTWKKKRNLKFIKWNSLVCTRSNVTKTQFTGKSRIMMSWWCHSHGISGWAPPWWPPPRSPGGDSHSWTLAPCLTHNSERQTEVEDATIQINNLHFRALFSGPKAGHLVLKEWLLTLADDRVMGDINNRHSHTHVTWVITARLVCMTSKVPFFICRKAHHHCTAVNNSCGTSSVWVPSP